MKPELLRLHADREVRHWWFVGRRAVIAALAELGTIAHAHEPGEQGWCMLVPVAASNARIRSATCSGVPTRPARNPRFETE